MSTEDLEKTLIVVQTVQDSIDNLNSILSPLYDKSLVQLSCQLTPLDAAKLHSAIAYSLATLEITYLRLSGISQETHGINSEAVRIRTSMKKIQETSNMLEQLANAEAQQQQQQLQEQQQTDSVTTKLSESPPSSTTTPSSTLQQSRHSNSFSQNSQKKDIPLSKPKKRKQGE